MGGFYEKRWVLGFFLRFHVEILYPIDRRAGGLERFFNDQSKLVLFFSTIDINLLRWFGLP